MALFGGFVSAVIAAIGGRRLNNEEGLNEIVITPKDI